jgi:hypothetical protein
MYNNKIIAALSTLKPIGLDAINSVLFMNRIDTKYVFSIRKLEDLINNLNGKYQVLDICNMRTLPYRTIYMDTPEFLFYFQHVRGELERLKIRFRIYESSGITFLEIKKKTNKNRTIKIRIENNFSAGSFDNDAINFIKEHTHVDSTQVKPVIVNQFTRATLIGLKSNERITMDYNISFSGTYNEEHVKMPYLAVVELKKEGYSSCSPFNIILKQMGIHPTRFSKYCVGLSILNNSLRKNNVKPGLLLLNKIENEYNKSY